MFGKKRRTCDVVFGTIVHVLQLGQTCDPFVVAQRFGIPATQTRSAQQHGGTDGGINGGRGGSEQ